MELLKFYKAKNDIKGWAETYWSSSSKNKGKLYYFFSTNYRYISTFKNGFKELLIEEGKDRKDWRQYENGQEYAKHFVINMTRSKLFLKKDNTFYRSSKGKVFQKMMESNFTADEEFILIYIFLLNSYFELKPNYLVEASKTILEELESNGLEEKEILIEMKTFVSNDLKFEDFIKFDIFWNVYLRDDKDFISLFNSSSENEKRILFEYIIENKNNKNFNDAISRKYKPGASFTQKTTNEEMMLFYLTINIISVEYDKSTKFKHLIEIYKSVRAINTKKVLNFIDSNYSVFDKIFNDIFFGVEQDLLSDVLDQRITNLTTQDIEKLEVKIDDTDLSGDYTKATISSIYKNLAKEKSNYKCELSNLHPSPYFTQKTTNKNYLEIHHLIPREFANEFDSSIEILENYVALSPHAHRLIHFATDRERESAIRYLYHNRIDFLKNKGLDIELEQLLQFYNVEPTITS